MRNPFSNIVPRKDDELVNKDLIKKVSEKIKSKIKSKRLIILEGGYGAGKTIYLWNIHQSLATGKEFLKVTSNIVNVLKQKPVVRNKTLIIDNFDLTQGLNDKQLFGLSEQFLRLINGGAIILIAGRKEVYRRLLRLNPLLRPSVNKIRIPGLTFEEAKELVLKRLNEARPKPLKSIKPFTEAELREIWRKAQGNPRIILMLCNWLYSQRMLIEV